MNPWLLKLHSLPQQHQTFCTVIFPCIIIQHPSKSHRGHPLHYSSCQHQWSGEIGGLLHGEEFSGLKTGWRHCREVVVVVGWMNILSTQMSLAVPRQTVSHPACFFMRHSINKWEQSSVRFIGWVQTEHLFHPPKAGSPLLPSRPNSGQPHFPLCGLQWFIVWVRPCEKLCLFCLLSYQLQSYNGPGVLTILPSGERRLWPGSRLAGETCCKTDWLVTMALLPWWLMVEEEVTSLFPCWL